MNTRVIKIGGSLLQERRTGQWFADWLSRQPTASNIILAGGGRLVDCIRQWQLDFELDDVYCHWLSIDAMSITAQLVHRLIPTSRLVREFHDLIKQTGGPTVFDPNEWLHGQSDLPQSWSLTSDSIAAVLAAELEVDELVLLKSSLPGSKALGLEESACRGIVDDCFPMFGRGLKKIRIVNLRSSGEENELVLD